MTRSLRRLRKPAALAAATISFCLIAADRTALHAQRDSRKGEWQTWGGDASYARYSPLSQIAKDNVKDLRVVWRWPSADRAIQESNPAWRAGRNEDTPLMVNGVLYTVTGLGLVAALDPDKGQTRWVYDPESYKSGRPNNVGFVQRGLGYWSDARSERLLLGTGDAYLISIDARSGKPDMAFGTGGKVDLAAGIPRAVRAANVAARRPLIAGDVAIVGVSIPDRAMTKEMPPGYVQAFDVRTGKKLWTFHTVPKPSEVGYETWLNGSAEYTGNTNVWTGMAYDPELDYVYIPTSTPTNDYYGGHRPGNNLFAESLVCVEAKTGRRVWHFQAVHHGLWDYDFPATPVLGDITVAGRRIKAVIQVSKQAFTYVFDRKTGEPVWPIEERPVPSSAVPGEWTSPTQPYPTRPAPFDRQGATENNLIDFTPELKKRALEQLRNFDHGPLFTPPSLKGTLILPGVTGGANWPGAAFDPETGVLYVASRTNPTLLQVIPGEPERTNLRYRGEGGGPGVGQVSTQPDLVKVLTVDGLTLFKPPYFRLTAIDMNRGEHLWMAPIGNGPRAHPLLKDLNLPPLGGGYHRGSVLVTKNLIFVSMSALYAGGSPEPRAWKPEWTGPEDERRMIYVFDKQSRQLLRAMEIDSMSAAAPMTYQHGGTQYVVVAAGAGLTSELVALSAR